ncbi:MAG: DegV family protein [Lachnospiraceae bacterium]|nr:DegV family protein [Lachnospiraceae bacterium]
MSEYQIFSDSSCDTDGALLKEMGVIRIPFYVSFDQVNYEKEIEEISLERFYERLTSEKIFPKTSLPSVADYRQHFEQAIKRGKDVLCICITSKFSGSFQSAITAKTLLEEKYPEASIYIVNSLQATGGQGLTVLEAAKMQIAGYSIEDNYNTLNKLSDTSRIMFTVGTLEYLERGGRVGKAKSLAGSLLSLKPLIELYDGELMPYGTVRGRKRSLDRPIDMLREYFEKRKENYQDYTFGIISGYSSEDEAVVFKKKIEELIGHPIDLPYFQVGVTIGTYTGPDPVGVCFIRKFDKI